MHLSLPPSTGVTNMHGHSDFTGAGESSLRFSCTLGTSDAEPHPQPNFLFLCGMVIKTGFLWEALAFLETHSVDHGGLELKRSTWSADECWD